MPFMALGKRIRYLRDRLGWTLEQLAERSGVDVGTISALEVRDSARSKYARQIAVGLGVSLDELFSEQPQDALKSIPTTDNWPFKKIKREDFEQLSPAQKEAIEDWVISQISAFFVHAQPTPQRISAGERR